MVFWFRGYSGLEGILVKRVFWFRGYSGLEGILV